MELGNNLEIYNSVRKVPNNAQKKITGGKLNGFTDINPMWRIQTLTEHFGPVGFGWKYEITTPPADRFVPGANGEVAVLLDINLYVKYNGEWSEPIVGTGGSKLISVYKSGPDTSDEAVKMAVTDAISVACKALGIGADIYWANGALSISDTSDTSTTSAKSTQKASQKAPAGVSGDMPDPKAAKNSTLTIENARTMAIDVKEYEGKTLGAVADEDIEAMKKIAGATKNATLKKACVLIYNDYVSKLNASNADNAA